MMKTLLLLVAAVAPSQGFMANTASTKSGVQLRMAGSDAPSLDAILVSAQY